MGESKKKYILIEKSSIKRNYKLQEKYLSEEKLLKTLSILSSAHNFINVPSTLLLLEKCNNILTDVMSRWGMPLMIRLDYKTLPMKKPLGGIPLYSKEMIIKVCDFLFKEKCCPMLQPNIERLDDEYSVGVLIKPYDSEFLIEVVGEGFDASDLRSGASNPHEIIKCDFSMNSLVKKDIISKNEYDEARKNRIDKIIRLEKYTNHANKEGELLSSLNYFKTKLPNILEYEMKIPKRYKELPEEYLKKLKTIISNIQKNVANTLPFSSEFIASLSYIKQRGWILWDIYSQWYSR